MNITYLNFQKAFEVCLTEFLKKLWTYGITGDLWLFFKEYLMGRFLCVSINHQRSIFLPLSSGVPQGSRPMVYLIYVDDLPHSIKYSHTLILADDIKCILPIVSCQDSINLKNYVYEISHECMQWKFYFKKFIDLIFSLSITPVSTS